MTLGENSRCWLLLLLLLLILLLLLLLYKKLNILQLGMLFACCKIKLNAPLFFCMFLPNFILFTNQLFKSIFALQDSLAIPTFYECEQLNRKYQVQVFYISWGQDPLNFNVKSLNREQQNREQRGPPVFAILSYLAPFLLTFSCHQEVHSTFIWWGWGSNWSRSMALLSIDQGITKSNLLQGHETIICNFKYLFSVPGE